VRGRPPWLTRFMQQRLQPGAQAMEVPVCGLTMVKATTQRSFATLMEIVSKP